MSCPTLITGCARSGTGYVSRLITLLGIRCGHESLFNPDQLSTGELIWPESMRCESSWLAGPLLRFLPEGTPVVHLVRHPRAVIRSLVRIRHFELDTPYKSFAEELCPDMDRGTGLERSARYWWLWNEMVERGAREAGLPYRRQRLEDLDAAGVRELLEFMGVEPDLGREAVLDKVLEVLPRTYNTRGNRERDGEFSLEDQLIGELAEVGQRVAELGARYGYEVALAPQGRLDSV